jgi:hypothetical protein
MASAGLVEPVEGDPADVSAMDDLVFRGLTHLASLFIHMTARHRC